MTDLLQLAHELTPYLVPLLPYLTKAGEGAASETGKKIAGAAWDKTKALWAKLAPPVTAKPAALEAVEDVVQEPNDEGARTALHRQLVKLLEADSSLAREVAALWEEAKAANPAVVQSGNRNVNIGGSNYGTINTGDVQRG